MINAQNIHKYYGDLHVLKGVNLHIQKGEIVSIVGASGAGKTTLLHILGTLDKPAKADAIQLSINDKNILNLNDSALSKFRNLNLGFIFQFHQLLPEFTALENVCIPAYIAGKNPSETEPEAKRILDYLGLSHRINHKPNELSGGEQQRVAVARALVTKPKLILADEPTGNLDSNNGNEVMNLLAELHREGSTIVMVTHSSYDAGFASRIINMKDGEIFNEQISDRTKDYFEKSQEDLAL